MAGAIAKNAQEGTRSEYFAQFVFSAFGTAIPVPHPEDSGIDLYCTLGNRLGRRFLVTHPYFVQVKSNKDPIEYSGMDDVKWLLSHNYPFFICVVNKKKVQLEIYQTLALTMVSSKNLEKITLHPNCKKFDLFPQEISNEKLDISLGSPIVKLKLPSLDGGVFQSQLSDTLKSWIELDQENIALKSTGFTIYRVPDPWQTNKEVIALSMKGNFKDSMQDTNTSIKFHDLFMKMLSNMVNHYAAEKDRKNYSSLYEFIKSYVINEKHYDSYGLRLLFFSVNAANKRFGFEDTLGLFK